LTAKTWQDVVVGDILMLKEKEEVPADILILATSEEEGRCFVETSNLDGETNLKRRTALEPVAKQIGFRSINDVRGLVIIR
jgi:P-type E1-E2 ATPase